MLARYGLREAGDIIEIFVRVVCNVWAYRMLNERINAVREVLDEVAV